MAAALYFVAQDWLEAFLTSDYLGFTYPALMSAVAAIISDLAFSGGRVTSRLLHIDWRWPI